MALEIKVVPHRPSDFVVGTKPGWLLPFLSEDQEVVTESYARLHARLHARTSATGPGLIGFVTRLMDSNDLEREHTQTSSQQETVLD